MISGDYPDEYKRTQPMLSAMNVKPRVSRAKLFLLLKLSGCASQIASTSFLHPSTS